MQRVSFLGGILPMMGKTEVAVPLSNPLSAVA